MNTVSEKRIFTYSEKQYDELALHSKAMVAWNRNLAVENSFIFSLFGGLLESTLQCGTCGYKSTTFEIFWDISISLPLGKASTLEECLKIFFGQELLDQAYLCAKCKTSRRFTKQLSIYRFPYVMTMHLKRYKSARFGFKGKLAYTVKYPSVLLISESQCCIPGHQNSPKYTLVSVSNHFGGISGGHYTAATKSVKTNTDDWLNRNDEKVSVNLKHDYEAAYILFYQKE